jgi:hypothetical protein
MTKYTTPSASPACPDAFDGSYYQGLSVRFLMHFLWLVVFLNGAVEVRAQLKADPARVDLGWQKQNITATTDVRLTNAGVGPIVIIDAHADCGCTVATLKKKTLDPGESTSLTIAVQTHTYQGVLHRSVQVQTTSGNVTIPVELTISPYKHWMVTPSSAVLPPSLKGAVVSTKITLQYSGAAKAEIRKINSSPAWVDASAITTDGKTFDITLVKRADAPAGNHTVTVALETNDPADPHLVLSVFVPDAIANTANQTTRKIALRVIPNPIILPKVKVGTPSKLEITLQGWYGKSEPRLTLRRGQTKRLGQQGNEIRYEVSVTPTMPGAFSGLLRVFDGEKIELETAVMLRAEPAGP